MLGSIPVFVPGFPAALKLGLAGGPLIMAFILGRIGSIGKLYWSCRQAPTSRCGSWGSCLFLSVVGLKSGGDFVKFPGQWRRAKLDWLWCPDHRRSADYCWHSGADVSQMNY
ncbi:hypothetical protein ACNKHR_13005 [Shigella flexneri]